MRKLLAIIFAITLLTACSQSETQEYRDANLSFDYPSNYQVEVKEDSETITVSKENARLDLFQLKTPTGERVNELGFGPGSGELPKQMKIVENEDNWMDAWMYFEEGDSASEAELMDIFNSIELKSVELGKESTEEELFTIKLDQGLEVKLPNRADSEPKVSEDLFQSFLNYEFVNTNNIEDFNSDPMITSIAFVSEESIQRYIDESDSENTRDRREELLQDFREQLSKSTDSNFYQASERECQGDIYGCDLAMYSAFVDTVRIDVSITLADEEKEEALISQISIE